MGRIGFILHEAQMILTIAPFKSNKVMHRSVTSIAIFSEEDIKGIYVERLVLLNWRYQSILD